MTTDGILALMRGRPADDVASPPIIFSYSNVIIDVLTEDETWGTWSEAALIDAADRDEIAINPIIYAEIAAGFATIAALDLQLGEAEFRRLALPYAAGFVAGRAFCRISPSRRRADVSAAGFLHWRPRGGRGAHPADSRHQAIRGLFSQGRADCAGMSR